MKKRWVICVDGTWQAPKQTEQGRPIQTNVVKVASAISPVDINGVPQVVYYHAGVGEYVGVWEHFTAGAFGAGLSRGVMDVYLFLVLNYSPGDELFLFGFSRGAYTVRSLVGLIRNSGILKDEYVTKYQDAYEFYRDRSEETHPRAPRSIEFRTQYSWPDFNIKFIGVWDTVGALGVPTYLLKPQANHLQFHDVKLSSYVDYAYQALAIDEKRKPFTPTLWIKQQSSPASQILEQAWFPGAHNNIGGGYEDTGLSDCTLDWMWNKATSCGLELNATLKPKPNPGGILYNSMTFGYQVLRIFGDGTRCLGTKLPESNEYLSQAAKDRHCLAGYQPNNVLEFLKKHPESLVSSMSNQSTVL